MPRSTTTCQTPKRRMTKRAARGFSLIELLVVVAIIGIIGAIAYPSYTQYIVRSNRSAAQVYLMDLAQAQSQHMADSRTYADTVAGLGMTTPTAISSKYDIEIELTDGPPSTFTITATPADGSSQAGDGDLSINSAGIRLPADKW